MKNLKIARKNSKFTQKEVAQRLGIPTTTYANYEQIETSIPPIETLLKISELFDCSIDYLFGKQLPSESQVTGNTPLQKKLIYQISQLDSDLCEIAEATIEGLYVTNQERKVMREKVQNIQRKEVAENNV